MFILYKQINTNNLTHVHRTTQNMNLLSNGSSNVDKCHISDNTVKSRFFYSGFNGPQRKFLKW